MNHFAFRDNELYCEEVPVKKIAEQVGTPFYIYSHATLKRHFHAFADAFKGIDSLICFSAKANTNLAVLKLFSN
ncbi:MAG: diaminopimelate decarboxylase, partial [Proteobacteria bacterium]|nr:diaminopimelate decarboxylase [Pseudomonadota bacterium]